MNIVYIKQSLSPLGSSIENRIESVLREYANLLVIDFSGNYASIYQSVGDNKDISKEDAEKIAQIYASLSLIKEVSCQKNDFVFFINGDFIGAKTLSNLKNMGNRLVSWQIDDPYWIDITLSMSKICETIFTCDSSTLEAYKKAGCSRVFNLPLGCMDSEDDSPKKRYESDICFIGTPFKNSKRVKIIDDLIPYIKKYKCKIIGSHLVAESWENNLRNYDLIKDSIIESYLPYQESIKYIRGAKINLNIHRDSYANDIDRNSNQIVACSPNERTFTLAGNNSFQIIDNFRPDLSKYYVIGKEMIVFSDIDDLKRKIEFYLLNNEERRNIAQAAQKRTLLDHTYKKRIEEILKQL